jgi:hypothetical protein
MKNKFDVFFYLLKGDNATHAEKTMRVFLSTLCDGGIVGILPEHHSGCAVTEIKEMKVPYILSVPKLTTLWEGTQIEQVH